MVAKTKSLTVGERADFRRLLKKLASKGTITQYTKNKYLNTNKSLEEEYEAYRYMKKYEFIEGTRITTKRIKKDKDYSEYYRDLLRANRTVNANNNVITQKMPIPEYNTFEEYKNNNIVKHFNNYKNMEPVLSDCRTAIYKKDMLTVNIQFIVVWENQIDGKVIIRHTRAHILRKDTDLKTLIEGAQTAPALSNSVANPSVIIGFRVLFVTRNQAKPTSTYLETLKAFSPNNNRKYHDITIASTTSNRLCSYETYLYLTGKLELKYLKDNNNTVKTMLEKETKEVQTAIKNGEFMKAYRLLTKKDNTNIYVSLYKENKEQKNTLPILIKEGEIKEMTIKEAVAFSASEDNKIALYSNNHIAPAKYEYSTKIEKSIKDNYVLSPKKTVGKTTKKIILGFDAETYREGTTAKPFNLTLVGDKNENSSFYGLDCVKLFVDRLQTQYLVKLNTSKTRQMTNIEYIYVYGFNNSNFDNLLIFNEIHSRDTSAEIQFTESSIKYILWHNIKIFDIALFYSNGDLRNTAKAFNLEEEKGIYPYRFPNKDNLYHVGAHPDLSYWNSEAEYKEFKSKHGDKPFDLKAYTEKYCLLDSKIVYGLAKYHHINCVGEIKGRKFNLLNKPTGAGLATSIYNQCFQEEKLYGSPKEVLKKEREAYKGGRTAPFKKGFSGSQDHQIYYYDRNSAHPASMRAIMPFRYIRSYILDDTIMNKNDIIPYYLYSAKSKYIGKNPFVIPNLLIREKDTSSVSLLNTDYAYHWGHELIEAIKCGFEITINETIEYEGKVLFKEFANYFYNERLKVKKSNTALANFCKTVLNSFYGKFGQRVFEHKALCETEEDIFNVLSGVNSELVDFDIVNDKILISYKNTGDEESSIGNLVRFSSYIAAISRSELSQAMRAVGFENVYYCDTDSIFTTKKLPDNMISQTELGKWKLEDTMTEAIFLAPKSYAYVNTSGKTEIKTKGVSIKRGVKLNGEKVNLEDIKDLHLNGKTIEVKNTMFKRTFAKIDILEDQSRTIDTVYNKRNWLNNNSVSFRNMRQYYRKNKNDKL